MPNSFITTVTPEAPIFSNPASADAISNISEYLTTGYWNDNGTTPGSFNVAPGGSLTVNLTGLTEEGRTLALQALDSWTHVSGISFTQVTSGGQITFDDNQQGAYSFSNRTGDEITYAHVNISTAWLERYGTDPASYALQTYIHEIGHALGLGHPGDYNGSASYGRDNNFVEDSWQMTIMSYFSQSQNRTTGASFAWVLTPQLADIRAIEMLYGVNNLSGAGDTTYGVGSTAGQVHQAIGELMADGRLSDPVSFTVVDRGGTDLIDLSTDTSAQVINLTGGATSTTYGLRGNMIIEAHTVIENLRAGRSHDAVRGNEADNMIWGGDGNDTIEAREGNDTVDGGLGNDVAWGGIGRDSLRGSDGDDWLSGKAGHDWLIGGTGADTLLGGMGDDTLIGGDGADTMAAGVGHDSVQGDLGADRISGRAGDDTLSGGDDADTLRGGEGSDSLAGNHGDDVLKGGAGGDSLNGGAGADSLTGWWGADLLTGGSGADVFIMISGDTHQDTITDFTSGEDHLSFGRRGFDGTLSWIDSAAFSGTAGELRHILSEAGITVEFDQDGDGQSDLSFLLAGATALTQDDIL